MELEERVVKLEALTRMQSELIRALVEMLPPPSPADKPLQDAIYRTNQFANDQPEPLCSELRKAVAELNPMNMPRRRT